MVATNETAGDDLPAPAEGYPVLASKVEAAERSGEADGATTP